MPPRDSSFGPLDLEVWRAGFHGYDDCPYTETHGCDRPFRCSEAGECVELKYRAMTAKWKEEDDDRRSR